MFLLLLLCQQKQDQLPLQMNMAGMQYFIEDDKKLDEESDNQTSSSFCVEQGETKLEDDLPFYVADLTQEEVKVEEGPYDQLSSDVSQNKEDPYHQLSSDAYVTQEEDKVEEDPYDHLSSDVSVKQEEIKVEEDPYHQLSSAAYVTKEVDNVEEDPYDQPSVASVKPEDINVEEAPSDQLSSATCLKHNDEEER
jgi:hypothetical protein